MRILVIANETVESQILHDAVCAAADPADSARVAIVAPALNSRVRHWLSDEDEARAAAAARLSRSLDRLADAGVDAAGWVGDADPLQAIDDALNLFAADRLVVATHPEGRSNWLSHDLVGRARERFGLPVLQIVVDAGHEEYVLGAWAAAA
jgi:hypothetical protein